MFSLGIGCHWKGLFAGCLWYADDLALLAPSAYALRRYALSLFLKGIWCSMLAEKTQLICFRQHRFMIALTFVGSFLIQLATWATFCHATYLIQPILKTTQEFIQCANCLWNVYIFANKFTKGSQQSVRRRLW